MDNRLYRDDLHGNADSLRWKRRLYRLGIRRRQTGEVPICNYINRVEGGKASVTISNYTDEEILYGTDFHLQKYIGSDWVDVSTLVPDYKFNEGVYSIPAHSSVVTDVKWGVAVQHADGWEYMLTKTVLDPKEDGTYDQATMARSCDICFWNAGKSNRCCFI